MRRALGSWILALTLFPSAGFAYSLKNLDPAEDLVVLDRLEQIQIRATDLLLQCAQTPEQMVRLQKQNPPFAHFLNADLESPTHRQELKDAVLSRMQTLESRLPAVRDCLTFLGVRDTFGALTPRRALPSKSIFELTCAGSGHGPHCLSEMAQMWADIQPHCFKSLRTGLADITENYACFGGDSGMDDSLEKSFGSDKASELFRASELLLAKGKTLADHSVFDFKDLSADLVPDSSPELTLVLVASMGSSGNSGLTGWLQGLEDRWLVQGLLKGQAPAQIYREAKLLQAAKIRYQVFRDLADQGQWDLQLYGTPVNGWNRHNFMAAFLGCRFHDLNAANAESLVSFLGVGYESADFVSHLLEGVSLADSKQNFKEDTHRYREAGKIGFDLCHGASTK